MPAAAPARAGTVLVVEDDSGLRELYRTALIASRYRVTAAADGLKALVIIDEDRPDVVVLDLDLPRISGWDVYQDLRSRSETRRVPIIIATAHALRDIDPNDVTAVLEKPVDPFQLVAAVDRAMRLG